VGPIRRRPLGHLKALDAGSWFDAEWAGESIPTQEEALNHLKGRVSRVYQDIKGYREMEDLDRMVTITRRAEMAEITVFVSSDWVVLNRMRREAPDIQRAYLSESGETFPNALDRSVVDEGALLSVEIGFALANPSAVEEAIGTGVELVTWTVDDPSEADRALEQGIRRITTNQVEALLAWRDGLG